MALLSLPYLGLALLAYLIGHAIYDRFFHPLSKFPGPFWASISRLPFTLSNLRARGIEYNEWRQLHQKHGPLLRITPTLLLVSDATQLPTIYSRTAAKSQAYSAAATLMATPVFNMQDAKTHAYHRRLINSAYSMATVKKMEPLIDARVRHFIRALEMRFAMTGQPFDFGAWAAYMAFDIISELGYGAPFGLVEKGEDIAGLLSTLRSGLPFVGCASRFWPFFVFLQKFGLSRLLGLVESGTLTPLIRFRDRLIDQRARDVKIGADDGHTDLLQAFFDARDEQGNALPMEYIKAEMLFVIIAGADTTGTAFSAIVSHIISNPEIYNKVMTEIDSATQEGKLSDMPQHDEVAAHCPYYVACVQEAMRLNPSVPTQFPRVAPEGGLHINGQFIPAGTEVACNVWVVQHDADLYGADVDEFKPERWLDADKAKAYAKYSFVYGYGPRVCLGRNIANMELFKAPMQFLRTFRPRFVDADKPGYFAGKGDVAHFKDMWMTVEGR